MIPFGMERFEYFRNVGVTTCGVRFVVLHEAVYCIWAADLATFLSDYQRFCDIPHEATGMAFRKKHSKSDGMVSKGLPIMRHGMPESYDDD